MITWPTDLPLPYTDATGAPAHAILASSYDTARIQRRLRFSGDACIELGVTWELTIGQYEDFKAFYLEDLHNGASLFQLELRHPKTTELTEWVVRFAQSYEASYDEGVWSVSASLQLLRLVELPEPAGTVGTEGFLVLPDGEQFVTQDGFDFYVQSN